MSTDDKTSEGRGGEPPRNEPYRKASLAALVALVTVGIGLHLRWLLSKPLSEAATQASDWLSDVSGPHLSAYALIFSPFLLLFSGLTALLLQQGLPTVWKSVRRSALSGLLLGACVFGAAPNAVDAPEKIFDAVDSCACVSMPMTISQVMIAKSGSEMHFRSQLLHIGHLVRKYISDPDFGCAGGSRKCQSVTC